MTIFAARNVCRSIFSSTCGLRIVGVGPLEQHLREARDAGQRRVDFVRDARREQADRRHLLGDLKLLLELHPGRDVLDDHDRAGESRRPSRRSGVVATLTSSRRGRRRGASSSGTR